MIFLVSVACIRQTDVSSLKALNSTRNEKSTVPVGIFFPLVTSILLILLLQAILFH